MEKGRFGEAEIWAENLHPPFDIDQWFEEDQPIYVHPKDPYKRVDVLPSARKITVKVDGVVVAESSNNMFLFETGLRPRYYLPKTSVREAFRNLVFLNVVEKGLTNTVCYLCMYRSNGNIL